MVESASQHTVERPSKEDGSPGSGAATQWNEADGNEFELDEESEEYEESNAGGGEQEEGPPAEAIAGIYNDLDVNDQVFEELHMREDAVGAVQACWEAFIRTVTRDKAGEAIYAAIFEAAPTLRSLFKTPRAVMAMRLITALNQIILSLSEPAENKAIVETLGFQHMEFDVTSPHVAIFRDAIVDLLGVELGPNLTTLASRGLMTVLNYVGGAIIFIRLKYTERLKIICSSWATANRIKLDEGSKEAATAEGNELSEDKKAQGAKNAPRGSAGTSDAGKKKGAGKAEGEGSGEGRESGGGFFFRSCAIPTTYNEMFMFNAQVMGFGDRPWMGEVLQSFDAIVHNVSNSARLQEECDVLALRISLMKGVNVDLSEYKAVMLASLRSVVPKDWNSAHEVAWSWLWENVERLISASLGKPKTQERALAKFLGALDEKTRGAIRRNIYPTFFELSPGGQAHFKQSTTRLHFIADRIIAMTLEMYRDPVKMVEDLSAVGLRHVGWGIPTEPFGPFVTACVQVVHSVADDAAEEAFRWSLALISRILTRVISEGSTIVMKAINVNSSKQLRKAVQCAPRSKRPLWVLNIKVGTQSISPLLWAIRTGSLQAGKAILEDLLTIRADRDRYYYGVDSLFERHPDIVQRLVAEAPTLLETLLDGLIWRSRATEDGFRRVNYFVRHLLVDADGGFAKTVQWVTESKDPRLACHPVVAMVTDLVWSRLAFRAFLRGKAWLIFTLAVFVLGVAVFEEDSPSEAKRTAVFACRAFTYAFSLLPMVYRHVTRVCRDCKNGNLTSIFRVPVPAYLTGWQDVVSLLLTITLTLMLICEPILSCVGESEGDFQGSGLFTQVCPSSEDMLPTYSALSLLSLFFYFLLTIDLSVFSTRVSAFVLISFTVLNEVWLYLLGMAFVILAFSCGVSTLRHSNEDFQSIPVAMLSLLEVALAMFDQEGYAPLFHDPVLMVTVVVYIIVSLSFLASLLVVQMNAAYGGVYEDMVGYARLKRGKIVTESMPSVSRPRWDSFVASLRLDEPCQFGEGDIGLPGAIQVMEPASHHIATAETIRRFGGTTSQAAQWPVEHHLEDEDDKFTQMEKALDKALRKINLKRRGKTGESREGSTASLSGALTSSGASGMSSSAAMSEA